MQLQLLCTLKKIIFFFYFADTGKGASLRLIPMWGSINIYANVEISTELKFNCNEHYILGCKRIVIIHFYISARPSDRDNQNIYYNLRFFFWFVCSLSHVACSHALD